MLHGMLIVTKWSFFVYWTNLLARYTSSWTEVILWYGLPSKLIVNKTHLLMDEHVIKVSGTLVVWPPATKQALRLKFSTIFTSNMRWHFVCWYPGGMFSAGFSHNSNAGRVFFIAMKMASHQNVLPFSASSRLASLTV